jgi:DNA (cytosine-5)-methyltransferase 1
MEAKLMSSLTTSSLFPDEEIKDIPVQMSLFEDESPKGSSFAEIAAKLGCDVDESAWPDKFGKLLFGSLSEKQKITTLSLFSGAGGLDIGFHDIGFDIIECVEIERKFCDTLDKNTGENKYFANGHINCIDIREYHPQDLPPIDFIIGGPPCQTFSAAGRRANGVLGTTDARGVLFREYVRLLDELQPVGFLFENVYGIIGAQNGEAWKEILSEFSKVGYKLYYRILDTADYGVPQHRERLIIVGLKAGKFSFPRPTHGPDSTNSALYYSAKQAIATAHLEEHEKLTGISGRYGHLLNDIPPGLNYSFYTEEMGHPQPVFAWRSKFSDFLYKADPNTPVRTIKAQGGQYTGPFHWDNRPFSISEHKRLQTLPDAYELSGNRTTQIHQIGNSVPPQMARMLAIAIRRQIFDTDFGFELSYLGDNEQLGFRQRKRQLTEKYRGKAARALEQEDAPSAIHIEKSYRYFAALSDSFGFKSVDKQCADFTISVHWNNDLTITVKDVHSGNTVDSSPILSIIVMPDGLQWNMTATRIKVDVFTETPLAYTAAWKAVEEELIQNNIKADLVQLCGYYQYVPKIRCELSCQQETPISFLVPVVNGTATRRMLPEYELAEILGVSDSDVIDYAQQMRGFGYEIRNSKTNPQIEEGNWLIPYAFPTLTPLSVQLRKSLR